MVESVVFAPDVLAGVVLQAFGHQIAGDRIVLDPLGNNLDGNAVNVVLDMAALVIGAIRPIVRIRRGGDVGRAVGLILVGNHGAIRGRLGW